MISDEELLAGARRKIEESLGWGTADAWTTNEFEELSERIAAATSVTLSATTLKRIWGKVNYSSRPSATTLNALAGYLGYGHWRDFRAVQNSSPAPVTSGKRESLPEETDLTDSPAPTPAPARRRPFLFGVLSLALLTPLLYLLLAPAAAPVLPPAPSPADYHFSFRPVTTGVPNSVVFNYHAANAPTDDVYLQQSWDPTRREKLVRDEDTHTSIYYLPGYYRAKLVIGGTAVAEKELFIRSDDWVAAVDVDPIPVYLSMSEVRGDGRLFVSEAQLTRLGISLQPQPPKTVLTHVGALENLWSDNFRFATRLRHDYAVGAAACQYARVLLLLKNGVIIVPLSAPGCVANLDLMAGGRTLSGKNNDLSAFGVVGNTWLDLECAGDGDLLTFSINGREVLQLESEEAPKEIIGIRYEFSGMGSVDYLRFGNDAGSVWEEDFGG